MFPYGHNPYSSPFQSYDPYEQLLLQQELQRRRQAEEYARRRQLEELNRRRAEQLEYARRQAELQRRREAEERRRRELELDARRRKLSEPAHPRGLRFRGPEMFDEEPGQRQSMFGGGVQDMFDALYGPGPRPESPFSAENNRRSASSDPRSRQRRPSMEPKTKVQLRFQEDESAVSDTEEQTAPDLALPKTVPTAVPSATETADDMVTDQVDTSSSRKAIADILSKFSNLKSDFAFPSTLDFLPSPEGISTPTPKLAYTPKNAPLHQYEHLLTGLLTQLDAVESYGDPELRKARKDVVRQIEVELEELDNRKIQEWRRQFAPPVSEAMVVESVAKTASNPEANADDSFTMDVSRDTQVDPVSIPLPQGEDRDLDAGAGPQTSPMPTEPVEPVESVPQPCTPHHEEQEQHAGANAQQSSSSVEPHPTVVSLQPPSILSPSSDDEPHPTATPVEETKQESSAEPSIPKAAGEQNDDYVNVPSGTNGNDVDGMPSPETGEPQQDGGSKIKVD